MEDNSRINGKSYRYAHYSAAFNIRLLTVSHSSLYVTVDGYNYTSYYFGSVPGALYRAGLLFIAIRTNINAACTEYFDIYIYKIKDPYKDLMTLNLNYKNYREHPSLIGSIHPRKNADNPIFSSMDVQYFKNKVHLAVCSDQEVLVYEL